MTRTHTKWKAYFARFKQLEMPSQLLADWTEERERLKAELNQVTAPYTHIVIDLRKAEAEVKQLREEVLQVDEGGSMTRTHAEWKKKIDAAILFKEPYSAMYADWTEEREEVLRVADRVAKALHYEVTGFERIGITGEFDRLIEKMEEQSE